LTNRRARRRSRVPISEINVTPIVDVMLVLLIIFMVTAPLLTLGVDVDANPKLSAVELPETAGGAPAGAHAMLTITVDADGKTYLQETETPVEELMPKLAALQQSLGPQQVFVRGDKDSTYGDVATVLIRIKEAGLPVMLLTEAGGPR
jgi:biopolymer transport protein TolR